MTRPKGAVVKPVSEWRLRSCVTCGRLLDLRRPRCRRCGGTEAARLTEAEREERGRDFDERMAR